MWPGAQVLSMFYTLSVSFTPLYIKSPLYQGFQMTLSHISGNANDLISDVSQISNLAFLSEVQVSLTELLLSGSQKQLTLLRFLNLSNKLYSGYSSGHEWCMKRKTYTYLSMTDILAGKKLVRQ